MVRVLGRAAEALLGLSLLAFAGGCDDARLTPILPAPVVPPDCEALSRLVGFGAGTTGGLGGPLMVVSTADQLKAAAQMEGRVVIRVQGTIPLTETIRVASDKTILGLAKEDGLTGRGLFINEVSNVIVQNLSISFAQGDAIGIQASRQVWVDHCELWSDRTHADNYYDGLVDITHACDDVTVSWTSFHDHKATCLVGHSTMNRAEDFDHLTVTFHHNHFVDVDEGSPRVRFGRVHVFNDLYENIGTYGVLSQMEAVVYLEGNVFKNTPIAWRTHEPDPTDGFVIAVDNDAGGGSGTGPAPAQPWTPPYVYAADPHPKVAALVRGCAGVGKITPVLP